MIQLPVVVTDKNSGIDHLLYSDW